MDFDTDNLTQADYLAILFPELTPEEKAERKKIIEAEEAAREARKLAEEQRVREMKKRTCYKCNGSGVLGHFRHVSGGVCFPCSGTGII
jgi:predicted methyltransferase